MRSLILVLALVACAPADDAGDVAFVQQAIPTVLGRKARGGAEINALVDRLTAAPVSGDRDYVIDALVARPEYVDYWTLVIADALRVQRGGSFLPQNEDCWGPPLLSDADEALLAAHIQTQGPGTSFGASWNMTDAVRGAIMADDLSVAWLGYLPVVAGSVASESDEDNAEKQFDAVYLNRNPDCLPCHNSSFSTVDDFDPLDDKPDRHFTSPWALEASVFRGDGAHYTSQYGDGEDIFLNTQNYDPGPGLACQDCHGADGATPNTLDGYGEFTLDHRVAVIDDQKIEAQVTNSPDGMPSFDLTAGQVDDLLHYLRIEYGDHGDVKQFFRFETQRTVPDPADDTPWGIDAACAPQFDTGVALTGRRTGFAGASSNDPDVHGLATRLQDGLAGLDAAMAAAPATGESVDLGLLDGKPAYAYMVANAVADALFQHGTGTRSTVAHGFSRNDSQLFVRDLFLAEMVDTGTFSLIQPLESTITFNLAAPYASTEDPYWFGMYLNPWIADPVTNEGYNGVGDLVHRYDPATLLFAVDDSLGWGPPSVFPDATATWPDEDLYGQLGAFRHDDAPGSPLWDMQSVLAWENAVGTCESRGATDDWITNVMDAARADPTPSTLKVKDLFGTVRDRLVGTSTYDPGEVAALASMIGVTTTQLNNALFPSSAAQQAVLEGHLRQYCAALLVSPHYTLAGIPTVTAAPPALRLPVCRDDGVTVERCSYADLYADYAP